MRSYFRMLKISLLSKPLSRKSSMAPSIIASKSSWAIIFFFSINYLFERPMMNSGLDGQKNQLERIFANPCLSFRHLDMVHPKIRKLNAKIKFSTRSKALPSDHWLIASAESVLGHCLAAMGRYEEAEPLLVESFRRIRAALGNQDERTLRALRHIIALYEAWDKSGEAAEYRAILPRARDTAETPTPEAGRSKWLPGRLRGEPAPPRPG